jgi:hypothetical protein
MSMAEELFNPLRTIHIGTATADAWRVAYGISLPAWLEKGFTIVVTFSLSTIILISSPARRQREPGKISINTIPYK